MAQTLHPPSPFLCQASLIENYALPVEASLSLMVLITVFQANNTSYLSLHPPLKKLYLHWGFISPWALLPEKSPWNISLRISLFWVRGSILPTTYNQILSLLWEFSKSFFPIFSSPLFILLHRFLHFMFWILHSCMFALDLRMLLCSFRVIIDHFRSISQLFQNQQISSLSKFSI